MPNKEGAGGEQLGEEARSPRPARLGLGRNRLVGPSLASYIKAERETPKGTSNWDHCNLYRDCTPDIVNLAGSREPFRLT